MNTKRVGMIATAVAAALAAQVSHADLVTYSASGTISETDNTAQLPSVFSNALVGDQFSVLFTVDTNSAGSIVGPGQSIFQPAIVSASANLGSASSGLGLYASQVAVTADSFDGSSYTNEYLLTTDIGPAPSSSFTGVDSSLALVTLSNTAAPLGVYQDSSLNNAPLSSGNANLLDLLSVQFASFVNGVQQTSSDIVVGADISIKQVSDVTSAPEIDPSTGLSALTLLLGSVAIMRRRRTA
jgi:hypothetical protein